MLTSLGENANSEKRKRKIEAVNPSLITSNILNRVRNRNIALNDERPQISDNIFQIMLVFFL